MKQNVVKGTVLLTTFCFSIYFWFPVLFFAKVYFLQYLKNIFLLLKGIFFPQKENPFKNIKIALASSKRLFGLPATQALSGKAFHSRFSSPLGSRIAVSPLVYYFAAPLCWTPSRCNGLSPCEPSCIPSTVRASIRVLVIVLHLAQCPH